MLAVLTEVCHTGGPGCSAKVATDRVRDRVVAGGCPTVGEHDVCACRDKVEHLQEEI